MGLMLLTFLIFLLAGAPIVFSFAFSSIIYLILNPNMASILPPILYSSLDSFPLLAIPLFLYAGDIMSEGGISKNIIAFASVMIGKVRGYLGAITVFSCAFFAAISGSGVATVGAIGKMMIPEMVKNGYPRGYASVLTATAAFLGVIIPPSIPMILYGYMSNTSIAELFIGGIIPGIILVLLFLIINYFYSNKFQKNNDSFESNYQEELEIKQNKFFSIIKTARSSIMALLMPVIILGGIYSGIFTPTEAAAVSVVYAILIGFFVYRDLNLKIFYSLTKNTAYTTTFLMITLVFATVFSRILTVEQIPKKLAEFMVNLFPAEWMIIVTIIVFLLVLGMLMDTVTSVIIATPILVPIATTIGLDLVHFGVVLTLLLAIGQITPPMAINLFLSSQISGATFKEQLSYLVPFIIGSLFVAILLTFIPIIVLFLPGFL
ncbi:TRAP transporter large permease [Sporosarcina sp. 179-K 3D1 HS]|uniref:TRAP transporter large permease n=1 Tax=Sporosarcina sp. 179-K 3D1 HS TaxID=3232169 RepID=UPI00399F6384